MKQKVRKLEGQKVRGCIRLCLIYLSIFLTFYLSASARAAPLIADLSNYRIDIDSGFNGTRIFLFGARNGNGDIIAVIRGPSKNYIVRKKEEVAGIWINREHMRFWNVPDFYAVAAAHPIADMEKTAIARQLGIGEANLLSPPDDPAQLAAYGQFSDALLRYQHERKLYMQSPAPMQFMGETLFKSVIEFPSDIPPGDYTAEFYLLAGDELMGMQSTPVRVVKSGMDAYLYVYAHDHPVFYGLTAVVLALTIGWFSGKLFEKA